MIRHDPAVDLCTRSYPFNFHHRFAVTYSKYKFLLIRRCRSFKRSLCPLPEPVRHGAMTRGNIPNRFTLAAAPLCFAKSERNDHTECITGRNNLLDLLLIESQSHPACIKSQLLSKKDDFLPIISTPKIKICVLFPGQHNVISNIPETAIMCQPRIKTGWIIVPDRNIQISFPVALLHKSVNPTPHFIRYRIGFIRPDRMTGVNRLGQRHCVSLGMYDRLTSLGF